MKTITVLALSLTTSAFLLSGCGTSVESRVERIDRRLDTVGGESQAEFNSLRAQVKYLNDRIDAQALEIGRLRTKLTPFCVQTRNGEMRQLLPKGSRECDIP